MRTALLAAALSLLALAPARADHVSTSSLVGDWTVEVRSTDVGRTFAATARVTRVPGGVRLTLDGRGVRLTRFGNLLVGRLPASLAGAVAGAPSTTLRLWIRDRDELGGTLRSSAERTSLRLRRAPAIDVVDVALRHRGAPAEPVRYFDSEAAWRAWYDAPGGATGEWVHRSGETATAVEFTCGRDDLWHEVIEVDRATGAVTVTAEH